MEEQRRPKDFLCGVVEGFYGRPWSNGQRVELFRRMARLGMTTYMYAPKDDSKHRAYWREQYTVEEAEQLTHLITEATAHGIEFVYAISPGLDIRFSSTKDTNCLKKKLDQVSGFGCRAFALLFDDIDPELNEADKEFFPSCGHAQASVTNDMYEHLGQPTFLFCPTEYSSTRAVPNIRNSEYLNTIGTKLIPKIDVMWTGPKVISQEITKEHIEELSEVLRRRPLVWDNLHANDYDQRRLFLGPYMGRACAAIPLLRGVLTNPNCEFESNLVAIHTLAQWSQCSEDYSGPNPDTDIDEIEKEDASGVANSRDALPQHVYDPARALDLAIKDWMELFQVVFPLEGGVGVPPPAAMVPTGAPPVDDGQLSAPGALKPPNGASGTPLSPGGPPPAAPVPAPGDPPGQAQVGVALGEEAADTIPSAAAMMPPAVTPQPPAQTCMTVTTTTITTSLDTIASGGPVGVSVPLPEAPPALATALAEAMEGTVSSMGITSQTQACGTEMAEKVGEAVVANTLAVPVEQDPYPQPGEIQMQNIQQAIGLEPMDESSDTAPSQPKESPPAARTAVPDVTMDVVPKLLCTHPTLILFIFPNNDVSTKR